MYRRFLCMTLKVCIVCDKLIEKKDEQVDYDVIASLFKYDSSGDICGMVDKPKKVHFHKTCFKKYKNDEKKDHLYFTQEVGVKRIVIMNHRTNNLYTVHQ